MKVVIVFTVLVIAAQSVVECSNEPYSIVLAEKYRDGGTVIARVTGSDGCLVNCRYDGKLNSPTRGRMYVEGRLARGAAEHRVFQLLSAVVDSSRSRIRRAEAQGIDDEDGRDEIRRQAGFLEEVLKKCEWR